MTASFSSAQDASNQSAPLDEDALGQRIRDARKAKGLTLEDASKLAGIGRSTLSKIENAQTKPSFDIVRRITTALDIRTPHLFLQSQGTALSGRRDFTAKGNGELRETETYCHELLCNELSSKTMLPYLSRIKARNLSDFDTWIRHDGEEFMFVVSGSLVFHCEHYRPLPMTAGDSIYYDSGMGHFCLSTSPEDALVLWVSLAA